MVYPQAMAVFDCFHYLQEDVGNESVFAEVGGFFSYLREEITVAAIRKHHVDTSRRLDDIVQGDDVRMRRSQSMEGDFSALEATLPAVEAGLVQAFDSVVLAVACESLVYDSVCAYTDDRDELECAVVDFLAGQILIELGGVSHGERSEDDCL